METGLRDLDLDTQHPVPQRWRMTTELTDSGTFQAVAMVGGVVWGVSNPLSIEVMAHETTLATRYPTGFNTQAEYSSLNGEMLLASTSDANNPVACICDKH